MILFEFDRRALKTIAIRFLIFGLPFLISLILGLDTMYKNRLNSLKKNIESQQEELVLLYEFHFVSLFKNMYDDLNLIKYSDEFTAYQNSQNQKNLSDTGEMFVRFMNSKPGIYQLRYLSLEGNELIKVDSKGAETEIFAQELLQNKKDRYYFKSLEQISLNTLYVSDFDLNMEQGKIEIPYRPTIRFGIPVYENSVKVGYLVANVNGLHILDIINSYEENRMSDLKIGLSDKNHLISLNMYTLNETLESSFLRNEEGTNPLYSQVEGSEDRGRFDYLGENYLYNRININNQDFKVFFDENGGPWQILSSYNEWQLLTQGGDFFIKHKSLRIYITIIFAVFIFIIVIILTEKETEHLLLLATGVISDFSHDGILITNSNRKVIYCNPIFENTFGYSLNEIKGRKPKDILKGKSNVSFDRVSENNTVWEGNIWDVTANNVHVQKYLKMKTVSSSSKQVAYYIGIYSEPKKTVKQVSSQSSEESSSILDQHNLNDLYPELLSISKAWNNSKNIMIALRIKDILSLKNTLSNDDEQNLIGHITNELKKELNDDCLIIAPYSDIFFIAQPYSDEPIGFIMDRLDKKIAAIRFKDSNSVISYSSGVSLSPEHGKNPKELIEKAFIALEAITRIKKSKYLLYNHDIFEEVSQYYKIRKEFDNAFLNNELSLVYQPQNDAVTGEIIGVEALVRWNNRELGNVPPFIFIPIMEEDPSQIKRLGRHILMKVLKEWETVLPKFSEDFRISINLSSQEFADISIIHELISIIKQEGFNTRNFCFEITETILSEDLSLTNKIIRTLHENKITVAIDDFGTGYSSLGYLKKLETDKIKVDRIFIKDFPQNDDGSILSAIIKMAKELEMKVIIEGIETSEQLTFINDLGCQEYQGYIASKPVKIETILDMIHNKG